MTDRTQRYLLTAYVLFLVVCSVGYGVSGTWPWGAAMIVAVGGVLLAILTFPWRAKPLYALLFRIATWASYTTFDVSLPISWSWAINVRAVHVAQWAWKRWLRLASEVRRG